MTKWELRTYHVELGVAFKSGTYPSAVFVDKKGKDNKTAWDELSKIASEGWELVSVTPLSQSDGYTSYIIYTFKRPKE